MSAFSRYEYRKQPGFGMNTFEGANAVIPMKTLVIHCFDPRAADIPEAVAAHFGDEVYPGENLLDEAGNRVGSTRTLFTATNWNASVCLNCFKARENASTKEVGTLAC